jgi:hypothetical protein
MQVEQIVAVLVAERDRLSRAIDALQASVGRRGRPPSSGQNAAPPQPATIQTRPKRELRRSSRA